MPPKKGKPSAASNSSKPATAASISSAALAQSQSALSSQPSKSPSPSPPPAASPPPAGSTAAASSSSSPTSLPLWLTEGSSQRDKNVLCESVYLYTPDGKTELVKNARVQFVFGRRYGLIGRNGIGKSTLLQAVVAGSLPGFPRYLRVTYVHQHDIVDVDEEVLAYVVQSDQEKAYLEQEEERLLTQLEEDEDADAEELQDKLDAVTDRLAVMDARRSNTRAAAILTGLGFSPAMQKGKIASLSGGWKQRVALACALFVHSDLLLLDEPTNHLDFPAVRWLEQFLRTLTDCTLVLVSHDRNFLNAVSTDIVELTEQRLDYYRGDYNQYVRTHEELMRNRRHEYEVQQKKVAELKQFIEEGHIFHPTPPRPPRLPRLSPATVPCSPLSAHLCYRLCSQEVRQPRRDESAEDASEAAGEARARAGAAAAEGLPLHLPRPRRSRPRPHRDQPHVLHLPPRRAAAPVAPPRRHPQHGPEGAHRRAGRQRSGQGE